MFRGEFFKTRPYKLGLTLSGGGAKCMAQIGLLNYLDEQDLRPDIISAVSGGAMVGALYSAGHAPEKILEFFTNTRMFSMKNLSFTALGLIKSDKLGKDFSEWLPQDSFDHLQIPLRVVTTDLNKAEQVVLSSGSLVQAILASSAYPGMFTPVEWNGNVYADGGIINNYPTDIIRDECDHLMGMYLAPVMDKPSDHFGNAFDVLDRVFQIYSSARLLTNIDLADVSIAPEGIEDWGAFMVKNEQLEALFQMGYESSKQYFETEGSQWLADVKAAREKKSFIAQIADRL